MIPAGVFLYTFFKKIQHWAKKINALASGKVTLQTARQTTQTALFFVEKQRALSFIF